VWQPWETEPKQLTSAQVVLVRAPPTDGPAREADGFAKVWPMLAHSCRVVGCEDSWCLYRHTGESAEREEPR